MKDDLLFLLGFNLLIIVSLSSFLDEDSSFGSSSISFSNSSLTKVSICPLVKTKGNSFYLVR